MTDKAATDEKFVVVEDEAFIRLFVCEVLADAGFEVIEAQHTDEAVAVLNARARESRRCSPTSICRVE
jgi:DNA-binding response OmpR family regulator